MQSIAASQAQRAMQQAFAQEIARQQSFQAQGVNLLNPILSGMSSEHAGQLIQQGADKRNADYASASQAPMMAVGQPQQQWKSGAKNTLLGGLHAKLGAYGDWQNQQAVDTLHGQQDVNRLVDTAKGQSQIFPYRMYDAQHSADELAFWGQLIASIGGGAAAGSGGASSPFGGGMGGQQISPAQGFGFWNNISGQTPFAGGGY